MFQALGGSNFSIGKAWESLEQLVAPIPDEEDQHSGDRESQLGDENEDGFENAILQHIHTKRQEIVQDESRRQPVPQPEIISDSPSSLTTITLDEDDTPNHFHKLHSGQDFYYSDPVSKNAQNMFVTTPPQGTRSQSASSVFLANAELEKSVQSRYREQLENEVQRFEKRIREQKETFENILLSTQEERDYYMKKVAILEENGRLDAVVESQQQEILELQELMRDLSTKLHSALEDKAIFEEKYKLSLQELQSLAKDSSQQTGTSNHSSGLSMEEQEQVIEQLTKQVTLAKEEIEELKNTSFILSQENENLVVELSDKDLMIHKLQTNSLDFEDQNRQKNTSQIRLQTQMLEESERSNDALRNELSALKLEYTTASIQWERAKAMLDKEIMSLKEPSVSGNSHMKDEIASLQQEVSRLEAALTQSEHILKESEEIAWKHKAEAAEILYAYESDQAKWQEERKSIESKWNTEFQNLRTRLQQESNIPASGELILTDSSSIVDQTQQLQSQEMAGWKEYIGSLTERLIASAAEFSSSSSIHQSSFSAAVRTLPLPTTCEAASLASLSSFRDALCEVMLFAEKYPHLTQKVQFLQEENECAMESAAILYKRLYQMLTVVSTTPNVINKTENGHSLTSSMQRALSVVDGLESNYDVNTISWKFSVLRMLIFLCELYNRLLLKALHPKRNLGKVNYYKRRRSCRHCKRSSSVIRILRMSNCKKHDRNFLQRRMRLESYIRSLLSYVPCVARKMAKSNLPSRSSSTYVHCSNS
jgi:hypothetical protein